MQAGSDLRRVPIVKKHILAESMEDDAERNHDARLSRASGGFQKALWEMPGRWNDAELYS